MSKIDDHFKAKQKRMHLGATSKTSAVLTTTVKGAKYGLCNLTACQKPGAQYYNKSTKKYYCQQCAEYINWPGGHADTLSLYGTKYLCEYEA